MFYWSGVGCALKAYTQVVDCTFLRAFRRMSSGWSQEQKSCSWHALSVNQNCQNTNCVVGEVDNKGLRFYGNEDETIHREDNYESQ